MDFIEEFTKSLKGVTFWTYTSVGSIAVSFGFGPILDLGAPRWAELLMIIGLAATATWVASGLIKLVRIFTSK